MACFVIVACKGRLLLNKMHLTNVEHTGNEHDCTQLCTWRQWCNDKCSATFK